MSYNGDPRIVTDSHVLNGCSAAYPSIMLAEARHSADIRIELQMEM